MKTIGAVVAAVVVLYAVSLCMLVLGALAFDGLEAWLERRASRRAAGGPESRQVRRRRSLFRTAGKPLPRPGSAQ
jgi:hypothetical protein